MNESADTPRSAERIYGEAWADYYDDIFDEVDERMIDRLVDLSGSTRRALELAVGTGRVAIPLSERGVEVSGIDISESMLSRLAAKPDGDKVKMMFMARLAGLELESRWAWYDRGEFTETSTASVSVYRKV